jgi:hypothetical protein
MGWKVALHACLQKQMFIWIRYITKTLLCHNWKCCITLSNKQLKSQILQDDMKVSYLSHAKNGAMFFALLSDKPKTVSNYIPKRYTLSTELLRQQFFSFLIPLFILSLFLKVILNFRLSSFTKYDITFNKRYQYKQTYCTSIVLNS